MKQKPKTSIIGIFLLTYKDGDRDQQHWQGEIIGTDGDDVIVQLFSWADGSPTSVALIKRSELYNDRNVRLFADADVWRAEGTEGSRRNYAKLCREDGFDEQAL